jgi:hypothetical protein
MEESVLGVQDKTIFQHVKVMASPVLYIRSGVSVRCEDKLITPGGMIPLPFCRFQQSVSMNTK